MPHEISDNLNVTKFTMPGQRYDEPYNNGWANKYAHDIPKDLDTIENMKVLMERYDPNGDGKSPGGLEGICSAHLVTTPIDPVDHSLETTPFKNMHYIDMINGFRKQVADNKN